MSPTEFCYWLQGYFELVNQEETVPLERSLTPQQVQIIQDHLILVFNKITPNHRAQIHEFYRNQSKELDDLLEPLPKADKEPPPDNRYDPDYYNKEGSIKEEKTIRLKDNKICYCKCHTYDLEELCGGLKSGGCDCSRDEDRLKDIFARGSCGGMGRDNKYYSRSKKLC